MDEWLQAAERGDVEAMTAFLTAGPGVNASTSNGETCLMRAAMHGQTGVVELLLTCGAEGARPRPAGPRDAARPHWHRPGTDAVLRPDDGRHAPGAKGDAPHPAGVP